MTDVIRTINFTLLVVFSLCYCYQLYYLFVGLFRKDPAETRPVSRHRFAVLIPARNEETVISGLIDSIHNQDYPQELIDIYVIADNCTDQTAARARECGARVITRLNQRLVGKGYALDLAFRSIQQRMKGGLSYYDGYLVFDADNVLDPGYFTAMNRTFSQGYEILTSYRNSKNYGQNWLTAGYALWFLRESRFLNGARMKLHTSCAISGTGFLVSSRIIEEQQGWRYHLLTEDIEFSTDQIIHGHCIGYCKDAVLYDEQPSSFHASWNQRLRWTRGFYQVFSNYGKNLVDGIFHRHSFPCFDMLMVIAPANLLTLASLIFNCFFVFLGLMTGESILLKSAAQAAAGCLVTIYGSLFLFGSVTLIAEHERIHCSVPKQILYLFAFPLFIFTYIPMSVLGLKKNVTWKSIPHSICCTADQICSRK